MNWNYGGERIKGKRDVEIIGQNGNNWWNEVLEEMGNSTGRRIILVSFSVTEGERLIICSGVDKL